MQGIVGALRVIFGADTAAMEDGLTAMQVKLASVGDKMSSFGLGIAKVGGAMTAGITTPLLAFAATAREAATESDRAMAQVTSALKSMGDASGMTAPQLADAAAKLQSLSTFDDDDILQKVTANLLTFGNVSGEVFTRAQAAIVDVSARLGTDLQGATMMVGKALNDPVKGIAALSRAGIQFTADQKEMIKGMVASGNAAGAQALMLKELERQFGGAAKAQRDATPGADMVDQWRNFQETVGAFVNKVLPPLTSFLASLLEKFNSLTPAQQQWMVGLAAAAAALGPVLAGVGLFVSGIGGLVTGIGALLPILTTLGSALMSLVVASGPIGLAIAAVAALYLAWKNWDTIGPMVARMYNAVKTYLLDKLGAVFDSAKAKIKSVGDAFYELYDRVVGHSYVPDLISGISAEFEKLSLVMVDPIETATIQAGNSFDEMAQGVIGSMQNMLSGIGGLTGKGGGGILGKISSVLGVVQQGMQVFTGFGGKLPAFANGGSMKIGGAGGIDSKIAMMRVTPGETIDVRKPGNDNGPGGVIVVHVDKSELFDVHVQSATAPLAQAAMVGGANLAQDEAVRKQKRIMP